MHAPGAAPCHSLPVKALPVHSALARLQATLTLCMVAAVLLGLWVLWPGSPAWAVLLVVVVLGGYAAVLAVEFVLAARWNRGTDVPPCRPMDWLRAWWCEVTTAPRVFAWRQPFRWRSLPDDQAPGPAGGPACVVLIHGFVCNRGFWLPWMQTLRAQGVPFVSVNLEPVFGSIEAYVPQIEATVARAEAIAGRPPLLLCHSMGGLAARAWAVTQPALTERVAQIVTVGSPHEGTWLGRFSHVPNGQEMRLHSPWLRRLQAQERQSRPADTYRMFICWYSNADNIVIPALSGRLPGADNRLLPGWPHVALAFAPAIVQDTLARVGAKPVQGTVGG